MITWPYTHYFLEVNAGPSVCIESCVKDMKSDFPVLKAVWPRDEGIYSISLIGEALYQIQKAINEKVKQTKVIDSFISDQQEIPV